MSMLFSSSVWHLAGLLLVQVVRLELVVAAYVAFSLSSDGSDTNDAFIDGGHSFLSRNVNSCSFMVCSGYHVSLMLLSLLRVMNVSSSQKKKKEN